MEIYILILSMKVNGLNKNEMEQELNTIQMVQFMKATGVIINTMGLVELSTLMENIMQDNGEWVKVMEKAHWLQKN